MVVGGWCALMVTFLSFPTAQHVQVLALRVSLNIVYVVRVC